MLKMRSILSTGLIANMNHRFIIADVYEERLIAKLSLERAAQEWEEDMLKNVVDPKGVHKEDKPFYANLPKYRRNRR